MGMCSFGGDVDRSHLLVVDLDGGGVIVAVERGGYHQAAAGGSGGDLLVDPIAGLQLAARSVAADLAEQNCRQAG
ncbi:MAG: hypothetical protein OXH83_23635 [Bryobacterales bacterium]|nr:hypothetical protein [Bryobacterales bacterium]